MSAFYRFRNDVQSRDKQKSQMHLAFHIDPIHSHRHRHRISVKSSHYTHLPPVSSDTICFDHHIHMYIEGNPIFDRYLYLFHLILSFVR